MGAAGYLFGSFAHGDAGPSSDVDLIAKKLAAVDPRIVRSVVTEHLGDLTDFVTAIRLQLSRPGA